MKKLLTSILALSMMLCATVNVKAVSYVVNNDGINNTTGTSESVDVTVIGQKESTYHVNVEWDALDFTYTYGSLTWNPGDHTYTEGNETTGKWDKTSANITVTNHSNEEISHDVTIVKAEKNNVTWALTGTSGSLPSAEGKAINAAELTAEYTVTVSGRPTFTSYEGFNNNKTEFSVGTVKLVISPKQ